MEYVPETLYRGLKNYSNTKQGMSLIYVKLYTYQVCELSMNKCEMCVFHCATILSQFYIGGVYLGGSCTFITIRNLSQGCEATIFFGMHQ
uniref:Uncharacterized protein n=2 Tax=Aegilops tauschii subsp. strangulata TaxID=200361 RepID=A0A453F699_AEGTS